MVFKRCARCRPVREGERQTKSDWRETRLCMSDRREESGKERKGGSRRGRGKGVRRGGGGGGGGETEEREGERDRESDQTEPTQKQTKKTYSTPLEITVECACVTPVPTQRWSTLISFLSSVRNNSNELSFQSTTPSKLALNRRAAGLCGK